MNLVDDELDWNSVLYLVDSSLGLVDISLGFIDS